MHMLCGISMEVAICILYVYNLIEMKIDKERERQEDKVR